MFMFVYVYVTSFPDSCFYMIRFHVYVDVSIYVYADVQLYFWSEGAEPAVFSFKLETPGGPGFWAKRPG